MAWTTPKTWTDDVDVLSATNLNTHLRDNLEAMTTWVPYTPTITPETGSVIIGNGGVAGWHITIGDLVRVRLKFWVGSSTSVGTSTVWKFSLPVPIGAGGFALGTAFCYDQGTGIQGHGHCFQPLAGYDFFYIQFNAFEYVDYNTPVAWAAGDYLAALVEYTK